MAILVDIKSNLSTPLVVNLERHHYGLVPGLAGTIMTRTFYERDPVSGELRRKDKTVHCPPAVTFPGGGVVKGLPVAILENRVIASMISRARGRRPKLLVQRQYDPDAEAASVKMRSKSRAPSHAKKKKGSQSGSTK